MSIHDHPLTAEEVLLAIKKELDDYDLSLVWDKNPNVLVAKIRKIVKDNPVTAFDANYDHG